MRQNDRDKRNYIIGGLLILVLFMTVGFAAFRTVLTINGTASISSNWCVGFDNTKTNTYQITKGKASGTNPSATMTYSGTACESNYVPGTTLSSVFYQPGDKIEYTLTIANKSSLDAAIESITVDGVSKTSNYTITKGNIKYKVEMPASTTLASNTTTTMKVIAEFQNTNDISQMTSGETQTITVGINAIQGTDGIEITPAIQTVYSYNTNIVTVGTSTLSDIGTTYSSCASYACLKYTLEDGVVTSAAVCSNGPYGIFCLVGGDGGAHYATNSSILTDQWTQYCYGDSGGVRCQKLYETKSGSAYDDGRVSARGSSRLCNISASGQAACSS